MQESKTYYFLVIELCKSDLGKVIKGMKQLQLGKSLIFIFDFLTKRRVLNVIFCQKTDVAYNYPTPQPCIPEDIAGLFFVQMILGLQNLHARNVLHRDLKPENLLLLTNPFEQSQNQPNFDGCALKLADFGFSRQLESVTLLAQTVCGTPLYMSPELMNQTKYGPKSDVWSCGCILYEMLTGVPPFIAPSNILGKTISTERVNYPPYISPEAHACLYSMLRKNPGNRADLSQIMQDPFFTKHYAAYLAKFQTNGPTLTTNTQPSPIQNVNAAPTTKNLHSTTNNPVYSNKQQQIYNAKAPDQIPIGIQHYQVFNQVNPQQQLPQNNFYPAIPQQQPLPQPQQQPQFPWTQKNIPVTKITTSKENSPNKQQPQSEEATSTDSSKATSPSPATQEKLNALVEKKMQEIDYKLQRGLCTDSYLERIEEELKDLSESEKRATEKKKLLQKDITLNLESQ